MVDWQLAWRQRHTDSSIYPEVGQLVERLALDHLGNMYPSQLLIGYSPGTATTCSVLVLKNQFPSPLPPSRPEAEN